MFQITRFVALFAITAILNGPATAEDLVIGSKTAVEQDVKLIAEPFSGYSKTIVKPGRMSARLREYAKGNWRDEGQAQRANLVVGATAMKVDRPELGVFFSSETAWREIQQSLKEWFVFTDSIQNLTETRLNEYRRVFERLAGRNVEFGYDAWQENTCAAPTPYLLVMDNDRGVVYGIDLLPCEGKL